MRLLRPFCAAVNADSSRWPSADRGSRESRPPGCVRAVRTGTHGRSQSPCAPRHAALDQAFLERLGGDAELGRDLGGRDLFARRCARRRCRGRRFSARLRRVEPGCEGRWGPGGRGTWIRNGGWGDLRALMSPGGPGHQCHMYPRQLYSKGSTWHWQRRSA
jgi:hypothetical protein